MRSVQDIQKDIDLAEIQLAELRICYDEIARDLVQCGVDLDHMKQYHMLLNHEMHRATSTH